MEVKDTEFHLLTIFQEKHGFLFFKKNQRPFLCLRVLKLEFKMKVEEPLRLLAPIEVVSSKELEKFCMEHGIRRELTTAYTPQQNSVSERKKRTILDMVRSLLARGQIPTNLWPEAANWSVHIRNRSPTFAVQNLTPEEAWRGKKPCVDHLRIFGCIAYAHVPDVKRKKILSKSEKCVFLGVSEMAKAYKLDNPVTKKIVVSRDVVFDEDHLWSWSGQHVDSKHADSN